MLLAGANDSRAQQKNGAVLLLPDSDMDRELADDLTEVLISSLIEKSGKGYQIQGKEAFRKTLTETRSKDGSVCLAVTECVRKAGQLQNLDLLVFGRVGKAMGGYRLEVWKLSMTGIPDRIPYRKRISGDVGELIEEVEAVADWVLTPDNPFLTIDVSEKGVELLVDGKTIEYDGTPMSVAPGSHEVEARKEGFFDARVTVACQHEQPCLAKLVLNKKPPDIGNIDQPDGEQGGEDDKTSWMPFVWGFGAAAVLAAGGGVYMYTRMVTAQDDARAYIDDECPNNVCKTDEKAFLEGLDPIIDRGDTNALWTNVLSGVAIGSAVGAATFLVLELLSGGTGDDATGFAPVLSPSQVGVAFEYSF